MPGRITRLEIVRRAALAVTATASVAHAALSVSLAGNRTTLLQTSAAFACDRRARQVRQQTSRFTLAAVPPRYAVRVKKGQCGEEQAADEVQHRQGPWLDRAPATMISQRSQILGGTTTR